MSRPPVSRENSSHNLALNQQDTNLQPEKDTKATEQVNKTPPPQLNQKSEAHQTQASGDAGFSKDDWSQHGKGSGEQPAHQQPKEKSSQDGQQKFSDKHSDTTPKGKAASSTRRVNVPSLKLPSSTGGAPGTATLKSRPPVSPDSGNALGSHRAMSPRAEEATKAHPSSSSSTSNTNAQAQVSISKPPVRSLPPIPQVPASRTPSSQASPISTSHTPLSSHTTPSTTRSDKGTPADALSAMSLKILDAALINGTIDPAALGYLMVDVQTAGFSLPTSTFSQGKPFLRAGLDVLNFKASNGQIYDSINLIEKFLQPLAEKVFSTPECIQLRKTIQKNYLPVASAAEKATKGMRPAEMQQSEKVKNLMDPVIQPLTMWVCGENENLISSQLPQEWKSMMLGIDLAVVNWLKNINCNDMKEIKNLRTEAAIAFVSTRGYMMVWRDPITNYGKEHAFDAGKLNAYMNSYFSHRAEKLITDILLSRDDAQGDKFDSKIRAYLSVLSGRKELVNKAPKANASGRRELVKSKTLQSTKAPPANSSNTVTEESATLSPRMREKIDIDKTRDIKQQQSVYQRQKFFRDFSKLANLAKISPEFFKAFQTHVVKEMSDRAYEKFEQDPVKLCMRYLDKFYGGVLNKERQAAEKSIRVALAAITSEDIKALAPAAEKVKTYVKPDPDISRARREKFLGNFIFYADIYEHPRDFLKSFGLYVYELSRTDYVNFEKNPISVCLSYVDKYYSSRVLPTQADRDTAATQKEEFIRTLKNISPASLENLRKSMAIPSALVSNTLDGLNSPRRNVDLPSNSFEDNEKQATNPPKTTASNLTLSDSSTPSSAAVDVKPVQENAISAERRNDFLNQFLKLANIHDISDSFTTAFKNHILGLRTNDYVKFLQHPIEDCLAYVNYFYTLPAQQETKQSRATTNEDKPAFVFFLARIDKKNREAITKLAAVNAAPTSTASTQPPQDSRTPPVASSVLNLIVKDVESEKTESSSETEIATESDSDADNANSEKTEES